MHLAPEADVFSIASKAVKRLKLQAWTLTAKPLIRESAVIELGGIGFSAEATFALLTSTNKGRQAVKRRLMIANLSKTWGRGDADWACRKHEIVPKYCNQVLSDVRVEI